MKRNLLLLAIGLWIALPSPAQDETIKKLQKDSEKAIKKEEDTTGRTWRLGGIYSLTVAQGSLNNWAAGGDEFSLSLNSMLNVFAFHKKGRHSWDNTLDWNLGYVKTTSLGSRKNDDRIDILSKYGYAIAPKLNLAGLFNFRSQFFKGYTYATAEPVFSSNFLSPAYVLLSLGLDYKPTTSLSIFISPITARWIIVKDDTLSAHGLYGVTPGQHSKNEIGAFASISFIKDFNKNVSFKSRLDLFANYKHKPQNIDLFMTNMLAVKLAKAFSLTWNVDLIYDDDVRLFGTNGHSAALQVKSLIGLGVLLKF
jgi:hypothetical protein